MDDTDLQQRAAGLAVDSWDGPLAGTIVSRQTIVDAFVAGHAAGWQDRARRDDEPPNGAVVMLFRPEDAERTMVYRRRDEWADLGDMGTEARWYILGMPGDYCKPETWRGLLEAGKVTELIEGDMSWSSR